VGTGANRKNPCPHVTEDSAKEADGFGYVIVEEEAPSPPTVMNR